MGVHDDHGYIERAGQDRDVRGDAAADEDDRFGAFGGELEQVGREQPLGDNDMVLIDAHLLALPDEIVDEPHGQVLDVVDLLPHVRVVAGEKASHVVCCHAGDRRRSIHAAFDPLRNLADELLVFENHQMGGKDQRGGVGELVLHLLLQLFKLALRGGHGMAEILQRVGLASVMVQEERQGVLPGEDHARGVGEPLGGCFAFDEPELVRHAFDDFPMRLVHAEEKLSILDDVGQLGGDRLEGGDILAAEALPGAALEDEDAQLGDAPRDGHGQKGVVALFKDPGKVLVVGIVGWHRSRRPAASPSVPAR